MLDLQTLIAGVSVRPRVVDLVQSLVPPPRFNAKTFEGYEPRHPTQSAAVLRLKEYARELNARDTGGLRAVLKKAFASSRGSGIYLDGGFGVGKTHLLAALWNDTAEPKSFLTFDELVYLLGLVGIPGAREGFRNHRLIAVDEWELDDPGNLKLALAFLRGALEDGARIAVTSNTLPMELGAGRFSQKDFKSEIEELAGAFEVIRIEGDDFRHRHFELDPGLEYFSPAAELDRMGAAAPAEAALRVTFEDLMQGIQRVHPIRYQHLVQPLDLVLVEGLRPIEALPDALRWVHLIDNVYNASIGFAASSSHSLRELFPQEFIVGPFAKKLSRCLSRMEELLQEAAERRTATPLSPSAAGRNPD